MSRARRPDALATMSDALAAGALRALADAGLRVPADVAVTGWDDAAVARPLNLTTVAQSMRDQGAACAHQVLTGSRADFTDQWRVVERASTRPGRSIGA
ncbi:substrate-binding domain-containing protein [Micromonospora sp. DT233]|uniref:substrate-binding domain-containing protein n=1 Tax=Micromonospora sp. DT233 TaxID=3393432 RepID=UPI003CF67E9C